MAKKCYKAAHQAKQELEAFNKSIESLELCIEKAANRELNICDELDWNAALADFDPLLLDPDLSAVPLSPNLGVDDGTGTSS